MVTFQQCFNLSHSLCLRRLFPFLNVTVTVAHHHYPWLFAILFFLSLFLLFLSRSSVQKTYHFLLCTTDRSNSFIHSFIVFGTIGLLRTRIISRDQEQKNTLTKSQCLYAVLFLLAFRFRQLVGANYFIHGSIGYSTHESAITNRVFVCAYMFAIT